MKQLRRLSYRAKILFLTFSIVLLLALILSVASWTLSSSLFSRMERELLGQNVGSIYVQLSTATGAANHLMTQIVQSDGMKLLLEAEGEGDTEEGARRLEESIQTVLHTSAASTTSSLQFVNVYLKNGWQGGSAPADLLPHRNFSEWEAATLSAADISEAGGYVPTCWIDDVNFRGGGMFGHCLVGVRFVYDSVTLEKVGVVVVGLKQSCLESIFSAFDTDVFLVRRDGRVISAGSRKQLGASLGQAGEMIAAFRSGDRSHLVSLESGGEAFVYRMSGGASWVVCPIDENLLAHSEAADTYRRIALIVTAGALALALLLSWLSSKGLTRSLLQLKSVVQRVYDGELTARFQTDRHDEIAYLGLKINDMLEQVEASFRIQECDAMEKKNLELRLMQSQINPHLLYNTLNSVLWIIRQGDLKKAEELIFALSSFFKLALSKGSEEIPLASEIDMIRCYLELQNLGRGKAYSLRDEVPERWRSCRILRLTLQPLVENAVIHGFCDWRDEGEIVLSAEADETEGLLRLVLCDNGIGILPEELDALMRDLHTYPPAKEHRHYGLYNVERRIENKYGKQYGMTIESEVGEFTRITLTLPIAEETSHA